MSGGILFPTGVEKVLDDWTGLNFKWWLTTSAWTPDPQTSTFASTITNELAGGGYARVATAGQTKTTTLPTDQFGTRGKIVYDATDPAFGILAGAQVAAWLVLVRDSGADATSQIVVAMPCQYTAGLGVAATFVLPTTGAVSIGLTCPAGFY